MFSDVEAPTLGRRAAYVAMKDQLTRFESRLMEVKI